MSLPLRIAVLASGRGSNFQALVDASRGGRFAAGFVGVFGDRPEATVLRRARAAGIPTWSEPPSAFPRRSDFDAALFGALDRVQPELIVLAGYMRIVSATQVRRWRGRMINIHPSLLPGYPGLRTHARVLAAGEREHGATVHFVTEELDGGPPIARARVAVEAGDTAETLARRVLAREHPLLVATVALFAQRRLALAGDAVHLDGAPLPVPLELGPGDRLQPC